MISASSRSSDTVRYGRISSGYSNLANYARAIYDFLQNATPGRDEANEFCGNIPVNSGFIFIYANLHAVFL